MTTGNVDAPGREVLVPGTGELVALDSATDVLAKAVDQMRELERELARVRSTVGLELTRRMDKENLRTAEVGEWVIEVDAPGAVDWDAKKLEAVLHGLVDHNELSADAMDRVMPLKRQVSVREVKKLLTVLAEGDAEAVQGCSSLSTRTRRIKVSPAGA